MAPRGRMLSFCTNWGVKAKHVAEDLESQIAGLGLGSLVLAGSLRFALLLSRASLKFVLTVLILCALKHTITN